MEHNLIHRIVDTITGEIIERPFTDEEVAQLLEERAKLQAVRDAQETAKAEAEAKREAALSKLAALGLTADDLKALGL